MRFNGYKTNVCSFLTSQEKRLIGKSDVILCWRHRNTGLVLAMGIVYDATDRCIPLITFKELGYKACAAIGEARKMHIPIKVSNDVPAMLVQCKQRKEVPEEYYDMVATILAKVYCRILT